jgi:2-C-methyl-D-erythritol 4-phosphate cytidylyltransferase
VPALPIPDTVKRVDGDGRIAETLERDLLRAVQTPQGFVASVLREALLHSDEAPSAWTDCSAAVEARGGRVKVVPGDPKLIKITDAADLERVAALL